MADFTETGTAWQDRLGPGTLRSARMFADSPGAPRTRRPTDVVLLGLSLVMLAIALWALDPPGPLSNALTVLVAESPGWVASGWEVCFDLLVVWSGLAILLALVRRHFVLALLSIAAAAVGVMLGYLGHRLAVTDPVGLADYLRDLTRNKGPPQVPGVRLAATTAVIVVMSPSLSRPYRFFGRILLGLGFIGSIDLQEATFAGTVAGVCAGAAAAAIVHLAAGSPGGRPSTDAVASTLAQLGVDVREIAPASIQPAGVVLMKAAGVDGRALDIKVYGRDAWDGQLIAKLWRSAWYRDGRGELLLSRLHQVEHEALLTVLASRAGANVPDVVTAGLASDGDAALISTSGGRPLADLDAEDVTRAVDWLWTMLLSLHDQGIVHGAIDLDHVTIDSAGAPLLTDWGSASVASRATDIRSERAQVLVLTAVLIGPEPAMAIADRHIAQEGLAELVPYLQSPALSTGLRREVRGRDFDLDALRDLAAEHAGIDQVDLVKLRRVTLGSVLSMALVVLAAWLLISALADIGLDTIVEELSQAAWGWVLLALVVAQLARIWNAVGTRGATTHPLRLGPTAVLEFAITFVNLVVPSSAGRIATKMRYFQKAGMTLTAAAAMGALDSIAGFVVQIMILLSALAFGVGGVEMNLDLDPASIERLATMVGVVLLVLVVVGAVVVLLVQSVRERIATIWDQVKRTLTVVRSPERMLRLFGGNLMAEITFAVVLGLSLRAYGGSAPLISLIVVNVMVALLAGLMPVPGGIGVSEAALTAGLIAIGVPEATAFATAITSRLCTFYLPPIWGYFAMRWLRKNQYL